MALVACAGPRAVPADGEGEPEAPDAGLTPSRPDAADVAREGDASGGADAAPRPDDCPAPCGVAAQCGCVGNQTCDISPSDGKPSCVAAGVAVAGRACLGTFECARGLVCASGVCRAPCATAGAPCAGPGQGACREYPKNETDGGTSPVVLACGVLCDYGNEASCGFRPGDLAASGCVFRADTGTTECAKVRDVQLQSGVCEQDQECGAGRVCVDRMGFRTCRRLCKVGDRDACGGCGPFPVARVVAGVTYGYCP